jgi:PKD repeat protein
MVSVTIPSYYSGFVWNDGDNTSLTKTTTDTTNLWVQVTDTNDCSFSDSVDLVVTGYTPDAIISHNFIGVHDTVDFIADPMQGATAYSWNFGDGNSAQGQTVTHTYGQVGMYTVQLIVVTNCGSDTSEIEVEITISGIFNVENNTNISMYPNPVQDVLTIKSNNVQLDHFEIYDYSGKRVLEGDLISNTINVNRISKGTYFILIYPKEGAVARIPFIKM